MLCKFTFNAYYFAPTYLNPFVSQLYVRVCLAETSHEDELLKCVNDLSALMKGRQLR